MAQHVSGLCGRVLTCRSADSHSLSLPEGSLYVIFLVLIHFCSSVGYRSFSQCISQVSRCTGEVGLPEVRF